MTEARGYMQRGLRFNKNKKTLWTQYLRLEMSYIAKIQGRREVLGLAPPQSKPIDDEASKAITMIGTEDVVPETGDGATDSAALQVLEDVPVQSGAIPIAIFDASMAQFDNDQAMIAGSLKTLEDYEHLDVLKKIVAHIRNFSESHFPESWIVEACDMWLAVIGLSPKSAAFPAGFRTALQKLRKLKEQGKTSPELSDWAKRWLQRVAEVEDLDPALLQVANAVSRSL